MRKKYLYYIVVYVLTLCVMPTSAKVPFKTTYVTKDGFAADTQWYTIAIGNSGLYISDNETKEYISIKTNKSILNDADLWCFSGDEKTGYKIYNKQAGVTKVLAAPTMMKGDAGSESYIILKDENTDQYNSLWQFIPSDDLGMGTDAFYMQPKGDDNIANNRNGKFAFWSKGADSGSSVVIALAVNSIKINAKTGTFISGNKDNSWFSKWVSNDKRYPITFSCNANNMKYIADDIKCYTGISKNAIYTISAPKGYYIASITLNKVLKDNDANSIKLKYNAKEISFDKDIKYRDCEKQEQSISVALNGSGNSGVILKDLIVKIVRKIEKPEPCVVLFPTMTTEAIPYRIPAITTTYDGNLLAVADYRHCRYDIGNGRIDLHGRISKDNGKTWGDIFTIVEGDGKLNEDRNKSLTAGYGDPCIVADRESNKVLMLCVCGYQTFPYATRDIPNQVARFYSEDGGTTWSEPEVITEMFYTPFDSCGIGPIRSMFIGSGRIFQSRLTKIGDYYRLYAAMLARDKNGTFCNFVVYSDDFGKNWSVLGEPNRAAIPHSADEPKTEELPDGNILISSRCNGGRYFNIFRFENMETAQGEWGEMAFSGATNNGVAALYNSCNGEIMILPAIRNKDKKKIYIALQSLPFGGGRSNVGIYYKELENYKDFITPMHFAKDWDGRYKSSIMGSAYSTMTLQVDNSIGFVYEEDTYGTSGGGYSIIYKSYTLEKITEGKYSIDKDENRALYLYKNVIAPIKNKHIK